MKFLGYETCKRIHKLKLGVSSKWYWGCDEAFSDQRRFYGLWLKRPRAMSAIPMVYFFPAYSFDDFPKLIEKLQKTFTKGKKGLGMPEIVSDLAHILAKKGWKEMEKELNSYISDYQKYAEK